MCMYAHVCVCAYVCACGCVCVFVCVSGLSVHMSIYFAICIFAKNVYSYAIYVAIYACVCLCTYVHVYM